MTTKMQALLGNHTKARAGAYQVSWPLKNYKAQPEKIIAAKPASQKRQSTVSVKELGNG